uniref:Cell division cycle protein 27 homolog n=1 Tax=Nomascus leucogenys TaxID=61853 RepID=A0A2I3FRI3_NOMLE
MTVLQEPVQAAIWQALNHCAYRDAVFLAERLYAEVHSEEALFLLETCSYRSGKVYKAYRLLKGHSCTTPQCKYLLAKCCVDLSKLAEGEQILPGGVFNKQKSHDGIVTEFGDSACFTLSLLGHVYCKTDRLAKGSERYQKSLSLKPLLWYPFESLCEIDPDQTCKFPSLQNFCNCLPNCCTTQIPRHSLCHRQPETLLTETPQDTIELNRLNLESSNSKYSLNTDSPESSIDSAVISPDTVPLGTGTSILSKQIQNKPKTGRIGQTGAQSVFLQSGHSREVTPILAKTQSSGPQTSATPQVLSPTVASPPNALPRRNSQLLTSDSSTTKENRKKLKMKCPPKIPNRKTKSKINKGGITQPNINGSLEMTKWDSSIISEGKIPTITPQIQAFNLQKAAAEGMVNLLRERGKGYLALCSYHCKQAIHILILLPSHHYNTGWVLCQIGRAYFELSEYMQAERLFSEVRRIENYRVEGVEIYSATLWHSQNDVVLSVLSKDLTDMYKNSPARGLVCCRDLFPLATGTRYGN